VRGDLPLASSANCQTDEQLSGQVLSGFLRWEIVGDLTLAVLKPKAIAVHLEDVDVVGKAIEQRTGQPLGTEDADPFIERQVAGDDDRAALVALAEDLEQQLGAGVRAERSLVRRRSAACSRRADAAGATDAFHRELREGR
jgi:hypothetical protein